LSIKKNQITRSASSKKRGETEGEEKAHTNLGRDRQGGARVQHTGKSGSKKAAAIGGKLLAVYRRKGGKKENSGSTPERKKKMSIIEKLFREKRRVPQTIRREGGKNFKTGTKSQKNFMTEKTRKGTAHQQGNSDLFGREKSYGRTSGKRVQDLQIHACLDEVLEENREGGKTDRKKNGS